MLIDSIKCTVVAISKPIEVTLLTNPSLDFSMYVVTEHMVIVLVCMYIICLGILSPTPRYFCTRLHYDWAYNQVQKMLVVTEKLELSTFSGS